MELREHQSKCKNNDSELKISKSKCNEITREIESISGDLFKMKQTNENEKAVDVGALEDDAERYEVDMLYTFSHVFDHRLSFGPIFLKFWI